MQFEQIRIFTSNILQLLKPRRWLGWKHLSPPEGINVSVMVIGRGFLTPLSEALGDEKHLNMEKPMMLNNYGISTKAIEDNGLHPQSFSNKVSFPSR